MKKKDEEESPFLKPLKESVQFLLLAEKEEGERDEETDRVVKMYPVSATTNNVEYRLKSEGEIQRIYDDLMKVWVSFSP